MPPDTEPIACPRCGASHFVSDLDFPDPEDSANTQYGWLAAICPDCGGDLTVSYERVRPLLEG